MIEVKIEGEDEIIVFYDEDEGYVICQSKDDKLRCYDGKGQVILEGIEAYFISEQRMYSNGYLMINYIDEEGS